MFLRLMLVPLLPVSVRDDLVARLDGGGDTRFRAGVRGDTEGTVITMSKLPRPYPLTGTEAAGDSVQSG